MNELQEHEIAGFELAGKVMPDDKIQLIHSNRIIDEWPKEIVLLGDTFELEEIHRNNTGKFQSATYA